MGQRRYRDAAREKLDRVVVRHQDGDREFEICFDAADLAVGTLNAGRDIRVEVFYSTTIIDSLDYATSGVLQVTKYDETGFAGTLALTLTSGHVRGAFDVNWDMESHSTLF